MTRVLVDCMEIITFARCYYLQVQIMQSSYHEVDMYQTNAKCLIFVRVEMKIWRKTAFYMPFVMLIDVSD